MTLRVSNGVVIVVLRPTLLNPVSVPLIAGLRSVRLRGTNGLAAVRRTVDLSVDLPLGFRMDLLIGSTDRVRVMHVVSSDFAVRWPGECTGDSSVFLLPMEGALALESSRGCFTVSDGGLALAADEAVVVRSVRPSRFLLLCIDASGGDRMHRVEISRRLPPSSVIATARTVLRAFLADLDIEHPVQSEYLQGTVLRLGRLLGAEREEDGLTRVGIRDMVEAAVQVILADYADPLLDPGAVADRCRVSLRSLQRAMAEERQTTLRDLIATVRTQNALRLVAAAGAEVPLADIARSAGFSSSDRLRRAIAAETGLSPTEYRRRLHPGTLEAG
ncbi:AraC family transcriptional regulator [Rathayibacter tanaceti]|uniref:DNA-binding transcriptional activator FeaR n=2 Tax=Rathayibacter tanaceti TaxID=1671680 RepID=A0A162G0L1_9MICO|nr:helix-turn-helix domain-containing protein [Rathayibacter tanaceti]KZX22370.1 DNA-binding transcriptional activator FeaR [Rathayibacter tanaceti]QHC54592.1 helix-turn-helix domain-containing protein [Rathayibacter tanaceti]TCO37608.1 AraC-like DNA-binding protein [Rathayibacter tanaceti]